MFMTIILLPMAITATPTTTESLISPWIRLWILNR
jgi:hypothetical protein